MKSKSILRLAWRYLFHRRFATIVSIAAIAVSLVFVVALGVVNFAVKKTAVEGSIRYPLIVGPAGASGVQLILSTIFHIDKPSGTIPFEVYEEIKADRRVISAYPVAVADSFRNLRIIGVNQEFLDDLNVGAYAGAVDLSKIENAVFGYTAAQRAEVEIGDTFHGQHGMVGTMDAHEHAELTYRVAGVLNPTGGPEDTAIYTTYKSVWYIHEKHMASHHHHKDAANSVAAHGNDDSQAEANVVHVGHEATHEKHQSDSHDHELAQVAEHETKNPHEAEHIGHKHDESAHSAHEGHDSAHAHTHKAHGHGHHDKYTLSDNKLTAVLVRTSNPAYTGMLEREYTLRDGTLAVDTGKSIRDFVGHINKGEVFVELVSAGMLAIALMMILVTLIMSLNERRKELALLRMLGVGRWTLALTVMIEALAITLLGALVGLLAGHLLAAGAQDVIKQTVGVAIEPWTVTRMESLSLWIALGAGQALAFVAMLFTYRMNVVEQVARD